MPFSGRGKRGRLTRSQSLNRQISDSDRRGLIEEARRQRSSRADLTRGPLVAESSAHLFGGYLISLQVRDIRVKVIAVLLQKHMHFHSRIESQHLSNGGFRQPLSAVAFKDERLKREPRRILALGSELS